MKIDEIRFGCVRSQLEDYLTTTIYINGVDLRMIIEKIETIQLIKHGLRIQNGFYEGISPFIAFDNQNHFLCKTLDDYMYSGNRYALFDYKYSGIPGDHSLTCQISIGSDDVIWHDFKNFSKVLPFDLNYRDLKFRFCINQYLDAINTARGNS
ncbi:MULTISPECIES: hypothetical protein [unclassified Sphingobacterium]|uniref:hypothetical protein n=1 Tax=unclassified Sphingobacterium TaxID=2609468 RepID=UPI0025DF8233|nr:MULTISPECIES: hypothetical protein [unclassified Sphingobacterium]